MNKIKTKCRQKTVFGVTVGKAGLNIIKTSEGINDVNKPGDIIQFKIQFKNIGGMKLESFVATVTLPDGLILNQIDYGVLGNSATGTEEKITTDKSKAGNKVKIPTTSLKPGDTFVANVYAIIDKLPSDYTNKYKTVTTEANVQEEILTWDVKIENVPTVGAGKGNDTYIDPENPDGIAKYNLSGIAWVDKNNNGQKEEGEELKEGIKVTLISVDKAKSIATTTTNNIGAYEFKQMEKGNYQILFEYNSKEYMLCPYKAGEDEITSKAIEVDEGRAITDTISLTNRDVKNINIGLVGIPDFYISIDKSIAKVIVQNDAGTKTYDYTGTSLAKVEIHSKNINNSTVLIEYKIRVKNEGELSGTVKRIIDYIPSGMIFASDLNPTWMQGTDGNLYNEELSKITIEPRRNKRSKSYIKKEDDRR